MNYYYWASIVVIIIVVVLVTLKIVDLVCSCDSGGSVGRIRRFCQP